MTLPPEKVAELKKVIQSHLNQLDIHGQMRNVLSESLRQSHADGTHDQEKNLIQILKSNGVVDDIMKTLKFSPNEPKKEKDKQWLPDEHKRFPVDPEKRYLYFQILGGKAFLEHLQDPEDIPGNVVSTFTIHVHFNGQRYNSKAVACACEPAFEEGFLMELKKNTSYDKMQEAPSLLLNTDKIHIVLIKHDPTGDVHLISSHHLEWRGILCSPSGHIRNSIEMNGVATESKIPVGVLDIRMDLIPKLQQILSMDVITTQMNLERSRLAERERLFLCYSKQWWREYLQIRSSHSNRLVKIFAQDENSVHRLVCSYIKPLKSGRLIDTPRQAARFVSLFAYQNYPSMSGGSHEMWTTRHCFLSRGKGDVEDHSILLCSLLLGFGLNAFVCIGTKKNNSPHSWVVTIGTDDTILFWESLTAQRYLHRAVDPNESNVLLEKPEHPFVTIGCLFNHETFYANSQPTDAINMCSFDIHNQAHWKSMSFDAIKSVCGRGLMPDIAPLVHLIPSSLDVILKSNELENELRAMVFQHRNDMGLTTQWDDELSYLLSPALAAYEFEQSTGVVMPNDDFQHAVRRNVPDGHTFKGFPIQFAHTNSRKAFSTCLKAPACNDIICCRGDQVKLALRVRVFPYPERTCVVWIMFAVKYKSVL
ncbi:centrosomal protein of 76 kDa-like isoform X1 [Hydra vulgaris]|uniref:Centrosomal protein of 76 kDa-like isoform X1 n=1 Tax=Hydra vulgaris TaxID=6087 RepID=A0ABM4DKF7_HYDVU